MPARDWLKRMQRMDRQRRPRIPAGGVLGGSRWLAGKWRPRKLPWPPSPDTEHRKQGMIRRAAFQKPRPLLILMILQWNFDGGPGFCPPVLSDTLQPAPIRSHTAN